jgi:hypothetical protein
MSSFRPATLQDFHAHHRQFGDLFTQGGPATTLWAIINAPAAFTKMTVVNDAVDLPAVSGIAKECWPFLEMTKTPRARKRIASAIGGMVRTVMVANGRRTTGRKRAVPPLLLNGEWHRVFKTGETYA